MPRPISSKKIVADANGTIITWVDGAIAGGTSEQRKRIALAVAVGLDVPYTIWGPEFIADLSTPRGAVSALLSASPGRTTILEAPREIEEIFITASPDFDNDDIYVTDDDLVGEDA